MLMDEFHFFEQGDDYAALDSTVHVTPCRVFVSTANRDRGMAGAFYDVVSDATKNGAMIVIDWKDDPDKARGLYHR
jgi:predicted GNAT superfamily acetyltransferase